MCKQTLQGGLKTNNGKNRLVPIHPAIRQFIESRCRGTSGWLFDNHTYNAYSKSFKNILKELGLNQKHLPHDPRKQFITMAKRAGVDEYAIKYMVGHSITDITEKIYTDRDIEWLHSEIAKISVQLV